MELETNVCSNGPGHVTRLAAMPIYDKIPLKSSSPNQQTDNFKLGIQPLELRPY